MNDRTLQDEANEAADLRKDMRAIAKEKLALALGPQEKETSYEILVDVMKNELEQANTLVEMGIAVASKPVPSLLKGTVSKKVSKKVDLLSEPKAPSEKDEVSSKKVDPKVKSYVEEVVNDQEKDGSPKKQDFIGRVNQYLLKGVRDRAEKEASIVGAKDETTKTLDTLKVIDENPQKEEEEKIEKENNTYQSLMSIGNMLLTEGVGKAAISKMLVKIFPEKWKRSQKSFKKLQNSILKEKPDDEILKNLNTFFEAMLVDYAGGKTGMNKTLLAQWRMLEHAPSIGERIKKFFSRRQKTKDAQSKEQKAEKLKTESQKKTKSFALILGKMYVNKKFEKNGLGDEWTALNKAYDKYTDPNATLLERSKAEADLAKAIETLSKKGFEKAISMLQNKILETLGIQKESKKLKAQLAEGKKLNESLRDSQKKWRKRNELSGIYKKKMSEFSDLCKKDPEEAKLVLLAAQNGTEKTQKNFLENYSKLSEKMNELETAKNVILAMDVDHPLMKTAIEKFRALGIEISKLIHDCQLGNNVLKKKPFLDELEASPSERPPWDDQENELKKIQEKYKSIKADEIKHLKSNRGLERKELDINDLKGEVKKLDGELKTYTALKERLTKKPVPLDEQIEQDTLRNQWISKILALEKERGNVTIDPAEINVEKFLETEIASITALKEAYEVHIHNIDPPSEPKPLASRPKDVQPESSRNKPPATQAEMLQDLEDILTAYQAHPKLPPVQQLGDQDLGPLTVQYKDAKSKKETTAPEEPTQPKKSLLKRLFHL